MARVSLQWQNNDTDVRQNVDVVGSLNVPSPSFRKMFANCELFGGVEDTRLCIELAQHVKRIARLSSLAQAITAL